MSIYVKVMRSLCVVLFVGLTFTAISHVVQDKASALASAKDVPSKLETRSLSLYHTHTQEKIEDVVYWRNGMYDEEGLKKLNHFLRDHRTGDIPDYDPKVFDILYQLNEKTGNNAAFEVICGYRCGKTNDMLRARSKGVAKNSQHVQAKAIDIRLPGTPLHQLRKCALDLKAGGVGYYQSSNFIHVDTGPVRCW